MTDKTEHAALPEAFKALGVRNSILRALADAKFIVPSDIQTLLIPRALAGVDILGQARTGTGKTAAFGIPILQMAEKGHSTQALILVPTRELAVQVAEEIHRIALYTGVRVLAVYGGQSISAQLKFLKTGPEILVGTPGRVMDLVERRIVRLDGVRFAVLDEVDRMLDIGFRDDIRKILSQIRGIRPQGSAAEDQDFGRCQTIFVSATLDGEIETLARRYMREPVEKLVAEGADDRPTVANVEQFYISAQPWDKYRALKALLLAENPDLAIVFTRTKRGTMKLAKRLGVDGIACREIHGDLQQSKRERVMKSFKGGKFDVLVATDLASRGIDVADISHIINFDIPDDPEAYVHRVGRTARMGKAGRAFTLVGRDQGEQLTKVESLINMVIPQYQPPGFEPTPTPSDWIEGPGGAQTAPAGEAKPNRYERAYSPSGTAASSATNSPSPLRTIGSKIPINRRHRRRR